MNKLLYISLLAVVIITTVMVKSVSPIDEEPQGAGRITTAQNETTTETITEITIEIPTETESEHISLGVFKLTAYCPCEKCCGWDIGITYSGTQATAGRTVGVHLEDFDMGDEIIINGNTYIAEDTGAFQRGTIDIFHDTHEEALQFGVQYAEIFIRRAS